MKFSIANAVIIVTYMNILSLLIEGLTAAPLDKTEEKVQQKQSHLIPGYEFAFETSDGVSRKETVTVKNLGTAEEAISVEGTVSWVGPDGIHYTLNYLADENGFQPEGKHLPVAPES